MTGGALLRSAALGPVVIQVAEMSFFAFAQAGEPNAMLDVGPWYLATAHFKGPFCGQVRLALPMSLANELALAFLGTEFVFESSVRDICGEFVNQVAGAWLSGLDASFGFELGVPCVNAVETPPSEGVIVLVNDLPVVATLSPEVN